MRPSGGMTGKWSLEKSFQHSGQRCWKEPRVGRKRVLQRAQARKKEEVVDRMEFFALEGQVERVRHRTEDCNEGGSGVRSVVDEESASVVMVMGRL